MHGLTTEEIVRFKELKRAARAARTADDVREVKRQVAAWIDEVRSPGGRQLRMNMSRAIRGAYSHFSEEA